jgi:hypothetical protein
VQNVEKLSLIHANPTRVLRKQTPEGLDASAVQQNHSEAIAISPLGEIGRLNSDGATSPNQDTGIWLSETNVESSSIVFGQAVID